jgi:hypothetical protein
MMSIYSYLIYSKTLSIITIFNKHVTALYLNYLLMECVQLSVYFAFALSQATVILYEFRSLTP